MPAARTPSAVRRAAPALIILSVFAAAVWLLAHAAHRAREEARFTQCRNNLKQIMLALHNYHDVHGRFPPAVTYGPDGKPWHSWRTLIRPYLEASPFYQRYRFDEPWDGPNNRKLRDEYDGYARRFRSVLHCPSDDANPTHTSYLAVIGKGTMWPPDSVGRLEDVKDGTGAVIQVVEVSNSGVHWMEPRDLRFDEMSFRFNDDGQAVRSRHVQRHWFGGDTARANAAFADGSVKPLTDSTPPETVKSLLLRDDGGPKPAP